MRPPSRQEIQNTIIQDPGHVQGIENTSPVSLLCVGLLLSAFHS